MKAHPRSQEREIALRVGPGFVAGFCWVFPSASSFLDPLIISGWLC